MATTPDPEFDKVVRKIAREEVSSLVGLVLRRLQDLEDREAAGNPEPEDDQLAHVEAQAEPIKYRELASIFGEALADFGGSETEPGS